MGDASFGHQLVEAALEFRAVVRQQRCHGVAEAVEKGLQHGRGAAARLARQGHGEGHPGDGVHQGEQVAAHPIAHPLDGVGGPQPERLHL